MCICLNWFYLLVWDLIYSGCVGLRLCFDCFAGLGFCVLVVLITRFVWFGIPEFACGFDQVCLVVWFGWFGFIWLFGCCWFVCLLAFVVIGVFVFIVMLWFAWVWDACCWNDVYLYDWWFVGLCLIVLGFVWWFILCTRLMCLLQFCFGSLTCCDWLDLMIVIVDAYEYSYL